MSSIKKCQSDLRLARNLINEKRRLDAQEKLEKVIEDLKSLSDVKNDELLYKAQSMLADLLDDMGYHEKSLEHRDEAVSLAVKLFGQESVQNAQHLLGKAKSTWVLVEKHDARENILKFSRETASNIGQAVRVLKNLKDYPNRQNILKDLEAKLTCVLMIMDTTAKIDKMAMDRKASPASGDTTKTITEDDDPYDL